MIQETSDEKNIKANLRDSISPLDLTKWNAITRTH